MYVSFSCTACGLRFPCRGRDSIERCPACKALLQRQPRGWQSLHLPASAPLRSVRLIADSIRSLYNVGALFRTADALGIEHLHLCGISGSPPRDKIAKVALGAEGSVPWSHHPDCLQLLEQLLEAGWTTVALETDARSQPLSSLPGSRRIALLVGSEVTGLAPELTAAVDHIIHLPQRGLKCSMNVTVAAGIALHALTDGLGLSSGTSPQTGPGQ